MNSKEITTITAEDSSYPRSFRELSAPPTQFFTIGTPLDELLTLPKVAVVGSRKVTAYGRSVTEKLAHQLAAQGIVIISGLALGVDSIAHEAALAAGGCTLAVLPGPLEQIYPRSHEGLAHRIIEQGGSLMSEYTTGTPALKQNFVARNRLVAALSDVLIITEAAEKSGSLHTARFARELERPVCAVPGNITSPYSAGPNWLIKTGAYAVTDYKDILKLLGLRTKPSQQQKLIATGSPAEQALVNLLHHGERTSDELQTLSKLPITELNQALTMLEISGIIKHGGADSWLLT